MRSSAVCTTFVHRCGSLLERRCADLDQRECGMRDDNRALSRLAERVGEEVLEVGSKYAHEGFIERETFVAQREEARDP
jgi:hypothetical protein